MTNETAPERIWAVYNEGSESRDEAPEIFAAPSADELMSIGKCYDAPVLPYVRADALEAAQARIAELEGAVNKELSDRMVAAGMVPLDAITKPNCLTKYAVHAGMTDLPFFMEWLERKAMEYSRMQAAHQTGSHVLDKDIFDFVFGRAAAFKEVLDNYRAALEGKG